MLLSYIVFLHQTTTTCKVTQKYMHCLISSFYIKPQQSRCLGSELEHCLILSFYIKPQLQRISHRSSQIVLYCLSTSNHNRPSSGVTSGCIVLYCLSTSNHNSPLCVPVSVFIVLYCLSTSNHNCHVLVSDGCLIVLYCLSTSNHNSRGCIEPTAKLSYIVFLHQTTTPYLSGHRLFYCLILSFYIKPQPYLYIHLILNQFNHI